MLKIVFFQLFTVFNVGNRRPLFTKTRVMMHIIKFNLFFVLSLSSYIPLLCTLFKSQGRHYEFGACVCVFLTLQLSNLLIKHDGRLKRWLLSMLESHFKILYILMSYTSNTRKNYIFLHVALTGPRSVVICLITFLVPFGILFAIALHLPWSGTFYHPVVYLSITLKYKTVGTGIELYINS